MPNKSKHRVTFYSKGDLSAGHNLKDTESLFENFNSDNSYEINDMIEFYQVKLYFDNNLYLTQWTEEEKLTYKNTVDLFWKSIRLYWSNIDNNNILHLFEKVDYGFYDSFWSLINKLKTYKRIEKQTFDLIISSNRFNIRPVLKQKNVAQYFSKQIRSYFISKVKSAEIILSYFEEEHSNGKTILYFPNCLSNSDKELIISNYLESSNVNLNYVNLIVNSNTIKLSSKTKLKAKKKSSQLNIEIFEKGNAIEQGVEISISKDQLEPVKVSYNKHRKKHSYSENWLNSTKTPFGIFKNFAILFGYINNQGCIDLVNKDSQIDTFEKILMRSKNEYHISFKFHEKSLTSHIQLVLYLKYLQEQNIQLEDILEYIVNDFLNSTYLINGLRVKFPSKNTSYVEKIRTLAPELEHLIKQYQSYTEDGIIDFELLEFSSPLLYLSKVQSKINRKYAYGNGEEYSRLKYIFFSDQSSLYYTEKYKSKYRNLYHLLKNEQVEYSDFKHYQKEEIDILISQNYLNTNDENIVEISNQNLIFVIGKLHYEEVVNYWYYPEGIRMEILNLERNGLIKFDNNLFSIEERKYINYYLNKKEFTNGLDLRNKYLHGNNTTSAKEHEKDYYILLKITILIIFKIMEDLKLEKIVEKTGSNN